ncbi:MAG: hypothetical protein ACREGH_03890 [Minisyncoccia bacterium]
MSWQKYLIAFIITAAIFATAFYAANRLDEARVADIQSTEQQISLDILSNETQYDLLSQVDCSELSQNTGLSDELNSLASQLSVAEQDLGDTNPDVVSLKEQYSLLEIKDYILLQTISQKCGTHPVFILYFYSNQNNCPDCGAAGDVLTYLRQTYPGLRVYSFDYNLNLSALKTLENLHNIKPDFPAYVIDEHPNIYGLKTADQLLALAPEIGALASTTATSTATSTTGR